MALLVPYRMGFHEDAKPGWNFAFLVRPLARHGCPPRHRDRDRDLGGGSGAELAHGRTSEVAVCLPATVRLVA